MSSPEAPPEGKRRFRSAPSPGDPGRLSVLSSHLPFRDIQLPRSLQRGPFRKYWSSQIVSLSGGWMQNTAAQLVVLSLTSSAVAIGALNVASALPMLLLSLFGGVIADRKDRRRIIITTQSMVGCISLIYAFLIISGHLEYWHMLVLSAVAGSVMAFEQPAAQSFVVELVDREDLPEALALNSSSFNATRTIGPAIAGVLIGIVGTGAAFVINAVTLLAPISVLISLKGKLKQAPRSAPRGSGLASLKEGMRYIRTHDDLLGLVMLSALFSFLVFPNLLVLLPLYVRDHLGGSDGWVAMVISIVGAGSLVGSLGMLRGSRLESAAAKRMRYAMAGLAFGMAWIALSPNPWVAVPGILIAGYSFTTGNTQISTRLQQLAPDDMRGRVLSANGLAFNGVMPFATLGISGLSALVGQAVVMLACSVLLVIGTIFLWKRYVWKAFVSPESLVLERAPS